MENKTRMGRVFRALGDVHRLQILDMLSEQEMNAGEILEAVDVVQSTLSHHMKTLTDAGLVGARRSGKWTYYTIDRATLEEAGDYLRSYCALTLDEKTTDSEKPMEKVIQQEPVKTLPKEIKRTPPVPVAENPVPSVPEPVPEAPEEDDIFGSGYNPEPVRKSSEKKSGKKEGKKAGKKEGKKSGKKSKKK